MVLCLPPQSLASLNKNKEAKATWNTWTCLFVWSMSTMPLKFSADFHDRIYSGLLLFAEKHILYEMGVSHHVTELLYATL